jgi:tetratricopeptide (TPR) repeat protein
MFWPRNLAIFYPFDAAQVLFWQVAACALLLLGISVLVVRFGRRQRYLPLGWFWFLGTLIPVIGIVQVGSQAYADRYTYIPYIGLFLMLAWFVPQLLSKLPQRKIVLGLLMILSLTSLGICAHRQVSYWKNSVTLFSRAIETSPNNWFAHGNLGFAYNDIGRYHDAMENLKQAVKINPYYDKAYFNLGFSYSSLGRLPEAIEAYHQAVKIKPDYAQAYGNLGNAYIRLNHCPEAIAAYRQAIKIKPDYAKAHYNLGTAYLIMGDKNSALAEYDILKSLSPQLANDLLNRINK